jgi:hypothetical protein
VEKLNDGVIAVLLVGLLVWLLKKIIWDWVETGRVKKGEYVPVIKFEEHLKDHYESPFLTVRAFDDHRKECCAIGLKREFNKCQQEACSDQARTDNRLLTIEEKLRDGQITFQSLNDKMDEKFDIFSEKFDRMNQVLARIQTVLEFALERKDRGE